MYTRILVPLDGSLVAEQVLPYVRQVATALKSAVELLRVTEPAPPELTNPRRDVDLEQVIENIRCQDQEYLDRVVRPLEEAGVTVRREALSPPPLRPPWSEDET